MDKFTRKRLKALGREDIIETLEINESGYAGILSNGNIVSRLTYPEAIPVQASKIMGVTKPRKLPQDRISDYVCEDCGAVFKPEIKKVRDKRDPIIIYHNGKCGLCLKIDSIAHMKYFNNLEVPKKWRKK